MKLEIHCDIAVKAYWLLMIEMTCLYLRIYSMACFRVIVIYGDSCGEIVVMFVNWSRSVSNSPYFLWEVTIAVFPKQFELLPLFYSFLFCHKLGVLVTSTNMWILWYVFLFLKLNLVGCSGLCCFQLSDFLAALVDICWYGGAWCPTKCCNC